MSFLAIVRGSGETGKDWEKQPQKHVHYQHLSNVLYLFDITVYITIKSYRRHMYFANAQA